MLDLTVISPKRVIFNDAVTNLFLDGPSVEYEILSYHVHFMGILRAGKIIINNKLGIAIKKGVVQFYENKCVILVEEADEVAHAAAG